jgi:uncharacterized surface protein with fasciclin (FAS1) repeats
MGVTRLIQTAVPPVLPGATSSALDRLSKFKERKTMKKLAAVVLGLLLATTAPLSVAKNGKQDPMVGGAAMYPTKNIVQNAVNSQDHTTLVAAVKAAGLVG